MHRLFWGVILIAAAAYGQSTTDQSKKPPDTAKKIVAEQAKPIELKRLPPNRTPAEGVPDPSKYPFDQILGTLQQVPPQVPVMPAVPSPGGGATPGLAPATMPGLEVPKDFHPPKEGPLSETGKDVLEAGKEWLEARNTPAAGIDGRVLLTFGAGLPTVICAPLRICTIELQQGEHLTGEQGKGYCQILYSVKLSADWIF